MSAGYTKASDWRKWKKEGYPLTFPSGSTAYVRPIALDMLLEQIYVPNPLIADVEAMLRANRKTGSADEDVVKLTKTSKSFQHAAAYASFISPRVVEDPDPESEDEISADDLDPEDLAFLVKWIGQPASALRKFSQQQKEGLEPLPPWSGAESEPEPSGEDQPLSDGAL